MPINIGKFTAVDNLDWLRLFNDVCGCQDGLLRWGLPEPWVQTQLFGKLSSLSTKIGWIPMANEVPCITQLPVYWPKHRNVGTHGAVKWVDLCLVSEQRREWCWVELKVRHAGQGGRSLHASKGAQDAIKKDIAALAGLNVRFTLDTWQNPDQYTIAYWLSDLLGPYESNLSDYSHTFVMAYLQLFGELDDEYLSEEAIKLSTDRWIADRNKRAGVFIKRPDLDVKRYNKQIAGQHSLVLVTWRR